MIVLAYTFLWALFACGLILILKIVEIKYGLPAFVMNLRDRADDFLIGSAKSVKKSFLAKSREVREAFMRTPHLLIHLALVGRNKLRSRFSHYIDEVKGRKPIGERNTRSEFLNSVKSHKQESERGTIE